MLPHLYIQTKQLYVLVQTEGLVESVVILLSLDIYSYKLDSHLCKFLNEIIFESLFNFFTKKRFQIRPRVRGPVHRRPADHRVRALARGRPRHGRPSLRRPSHPGRFERGVLGESGSSLSVTRLGI